MKSQVFAAIFISGCIVFAPSAISEIAIVDGDTFDLDGTRIRVNGIDAPEYGQKCGSQDCGVEALEALNNLIHSGPIHCQSMGDDGYGRVIGKCVVGGQDIGASLVS